jgi:DNA invertase Pin-like site-specific DNA recombinase
MAAQRGYNIIHEYTDKISGTKAKRPGLDQMMAEARRGRFDVFVNDLVATLRSAILHAEGGGT